MLTACRRWVGLKCEYRIVVATSRCPRISLTLKRSTPAKESDYIIQYYTPGTAPAVLPQEVRTFDANARGWMADAGLSREQGNSLVATMSKMIQHTHPLSTNEREAYKDAENAKLEQLFGDKLQNELRPAARMIDELDRKRPGLKDFVRAHGDNALFVTQLIQAAHIYDKRKGR